MSEVKYKAVKNAGNNCDGCHHYETTKNKENIRCYAFIENRLKEGLPDCSESFIYQLDNSKVPLKQAREKFEKMIVPHYTLKYSDGTYYDRDIQNKWRGFQQALKDFDILEEGE